VTQAATPNRAIRFPTRSLQARLRLAGGAALLLAALAAAPAVRAQNGDPPEITAQGFNIENAQEGLLGHFGRLRVRIEAPEGIETLYIKERSYEVDLAVTPERAHYGLFGIEKRVGLHKDVTLNFERYIDRKLEAAGSYRFLIRVTDGAARSASATLSVTVREEPPRAEAMDPEMAPVSKSAFNFQRIGAGSVVGAEDFGLTWKTIEDARIVIEITGTEDKAARLIELAESDYDRIETRKALAEAADKAGPVERIAVPTAQNLAAGRIFVVVKQDDYLLFKVEESATSLSELGTTVTLTGEYKH